MFSFLLFLQLTGTQALVREGSNESSLSPANHEASPMIGKARALVDYNPSPYDRDALKFKVIFLSFKFKLVHGTHLVDLYNTHLTNLADNVTER